MPLTCAPTYPHRHAGPAIVLGGGRGGAAELAEARAHMPGAPVVAVNFACCELARDARFVVTAHPLIVRMLRAAAPAAEQHIFLYNAAAGADDHDYCWTSDEREARGTSSLCAVAIAKAIGFGPIVICGVPLDASGHEPGYVPAGMVAQGEFANAAGAPLVIAGRVEFWREYRDKGGLADVTSLSGATAELLGLPPWRPQPRKPSAMAKKKDAPTTARLIVAPGNTYHMIGQAAGPGETIEVSLAEAERLRRLGVAKDAPDDTKAA